MDYSGHGHVGCSTHGSLGNPTTTTTTHFHLLIFKHVHFLYFSEPGTLQFEKRGYLVKESCGDAEIAILRQNGADGAIAVHWRTIDKTAIHGKDYSGGEGLIEFNHGEVNMKNILFPRLQFCYSTNNFNFYNFYAAFLKALLKGFTNNNLLCCFCEILKN